MSRHIPSAPGSTRLKKTVPVVKALLECDNVCGVGGLLIFEVCKKGVCRWQVQQALEVNISFN